MFAEAMVGTRMGTQETYQTSLTHKDTLASLNFSMCQIHKEFLPSQYPIQAVD